MRAATFSVSVLALLAAGQAYAADLYRAPDGGSYKDGPAFAEVNWSGFYVGAHAGGAWGENSYKDFNPPSGFVYYSGNYSTSGVIGGGQAGYNLQKGNTVFGLETDLGGAGLRGSKHIFWADPADNNETGNYRYSSSGGLYGDLTGRLGFAYSRALLYVKGGAAFLDSSYHADYITTANSVVGGQGAAHSEGFLWGWTAGAGIEYLVCPDWSVKAEYQHFDFGDATIQYDPSEKVRFTTAFDAVTVGVNYHLSHGDEPLK